MARVIASREELCKKYGASSSSGSSGGSSGGSYSIGRKSSSGSIFDKYEQNEQNFSSGSLVADYLKKCSALFGRSVEDGAHKAGALIDNDKWLVDMDLDGDGKTEQDIKIADAIALSFDSELDLYIQQNLEDVIEKYGPQCNYNMRAMFGSTDSPAFRDLLALGIRADAIGDEDAWQNRTYSFSLIDTSAIDDAKQERMSELRGKDPKALTEAEKKELEELYGEYYDVIYAEDAKILEDGNHAKGSMIFSDCLIPDGTAGGAEVNLSSILDSMGYECISKADFVNNPDEYFQLLDQIEEMIGNKEFDAKQSVKDLYGEYTLDISTAVRAVYTANGNAYGSYSDGYWGKAMTFDENLALIAKRGLGSTGSLSGFSSTPTLGEDGTYQVAGKTLRDKDGNPFREGDEDKLNSYIEEIFQEKEYAVLSAEKRAEAAEAEKAEEKAQLEEEAKFIEKTGEIYEQIVADFKKSYYEENGKEHGVLSYSQIAEFKKQAEEEATKELY